MADPVMLDPDSTEWLMMPDAPENPLSDPSDIVALVQQILSSLDETDQRMIHLIHYERMTFQQAARQIGLRAKSHAWRKTQAAMQRFEKALRSNPQLMEMMEKRYGITEA